MPETVQDPVLSGKDANTECTNTLNLHITIFHRAIIMNYTVNYIQVKYFKWNNHF